MPTPFGRRSVFSGAEARPLNAPPPGMVRAHAGSLEPRTPVPNWNGIEYDGKLKCRAEAKRGGQCTAWAMPGTERCHGHTDKG